MIRNDFYVELTNKIIADLEKGIIPWERPWFVSKAINACTGKAYRGINQLNLAMVSADLQLDNADMRFLTFNQAKAKGWSVKKGSKSLAQVVYFSIIEKETQKDEQEQLEEGSTKFPLLKFSSVFHASQIDGIPELPAVQKVNFEPNAIAEKIISKSNAKIVEDSSHAFFSSADYIGIPHRDKFKTVEGYYGTLLHELGHWTGHPSRLNRGVFNAFGSEEYAREELVAELASVFLSAETGIQYVSGNHTAYIGNWIHALKNDPLEIRRASSKAIQAVDYLLSIAGMKGSDGEEIIRP